MNMASIPVSRKGYPYYIYTPPYRETSAGIVVMHTLCDVLNREGYEAYIAGTDVVNPAFDTPLATQEVQMRHKALGIDPIAVYPEVVSGNPQNADVCVRYILNKIGFLTGKPLNEGKDDLFFYYSENFLGDAKKADVDFLFLPVLDTELFKPDPTVKKDRTFVFQYRYPLDKIDFSLFPAGTELLSMANPVSLPELARKLQGGRVLYSYELSSVCPEAMMCGCPVIFMPDGGLTDVPDQFAFGTNGSAMSTEKNGFARALATVDMIYPTVVAMSKVFRAQLPVFLEKTQRAAEKASLRRRTSPAVQAPQASQAPRPRISVLTMEPLAHRSVVTRIKKPFDMLADHWELSWPVQDNAGAVGAFDMLLLQRRFLMSVSQEQLEKVFATGKPVVYDTDEPMHDLPADHPLRFMSELTAEKTEYAMRRADALVVSTPALAEALRPYNANIHVLPTAIDFDLFYSPVRVHTGKVRIGLMGSAMKPCNYAQIAPALNAIRARFAGDVHFVFVGALPPEDWLGLNNVTMTGTPGSYDAHAASFRQLELDIALMPLAMSETGDGEPRTEWLEYAAAGVATIGSDHPAYNELVTNGCSGLRVPADSPQAWVEAVGRLIANPAQRRSLARTAQAIAYKSGSLQSQIARHHEVYLRCLGVNLGGASADAPERIPAVLILDAEGDAQKIEHSLSLHAEGPLREHMAVVLTTQQTALPEWTDNLRYLQATADEFPGAAQEVCGHAEFDWKLITEAGVALL